MNELRKTAAYVCVAALLALAAFATVPRTRSASADFPDKGQGFFPDFTDPNTATTLEVVDFDEATATARPFKVMFKNGRWTIPSHHGYPADGKDRLAKTAAALIGITKDDFRSSNASDHESFGVIEPLDDAASSLKGRGQRVTIKDAQDHVLADLIVGKRVEGRENLRFVRLPSEKRVYASRIDIDISTRFEDWIERDLLQVVRNDIKRVVLRDYSIDEATGMVRNRDTLALDKGDTDTTWKANRMAPGEEVVNDKMNDLLNALDTLSIVGVRPKPKGLSQNLKKTSGGISISPEDMASLEDRGYYFASNGELLSNEGEMEARTSDGIIYTLRFGEIVYGEGESVSAGAESADKSKSGPGENRYLFITASHDPKSAPEPAKPANMAFEGKETSAMSDEDHRNKALHETHEKWASNLSASAKRSERLNARFADWYYVISADSYRKLRLTRKELVHPKP